MTVGTGQFSAPSPSSAGRRPIVATGPFVARLLAEIPALSDPTANDFERVNALREWAYAHIPLALSADVLLDTLEPDYMSWPLERLFQTFKRDAGALWAYGTATVFSRICHQMGYPAATLHFGDLESPQNHHVSIVKVDIDGAPRFIVEDAYFNFVLTNSEGRALDWREVVQLLRDRRSADILAHPRDGQLKSFVLRNSENGRPPFEHTSYAVWGFFGPGWSNWAVRNVTSTNSLYAFLFPRSLKPIGDPGSFDQVVDLMEERPVPDSWRAEDRHIRLAACSCDDQFEKVVLEFTRDELCEFYADDPWRRNQAINVWEYKSGETVLTTYPRDVCIPIADICNARCSFCTSWLEGTRLLKLQEMDGYEAVIEHAQRIGLAGHGEPLSHPQIKEILTKLQAWLNPRAYCYLITNGVYLGKLMDELLRSRVNSYSIILNGATAATHREVMGLKEGAFEDILNSIRRLIAIRDGDTSIWIWVSISLVITAQNVHEIADFVRLANELRVNAVQLKTLAGQGGATAGLNYHLLPPYEHPEFARHKVAALKAIASSRVEVQASPESWDTPVFPTVVAKGFRDNPPPFISREDALKSRAIRETMGAQEKFSRRMQGAFRENVRDFDGNNPFGREPRYACKAPYYYLYVNDFSFTMVPCCYMVNVPGHDHVMWDGTGDFFEAWNSPAMVNLRTRLRDGPLFNMCTKCPSIY